MSNKLRKSKNGNRVSEIITGLLILCISFLVVSAIITQQDINPDYSTLHEDLQYLNNHLERLILNTFIWLINSILIILLGPFILLSFLPYGRSAPYVISFLISTTGIMYMLFSIFGFNLSEYAKLYEEFSEENQNFIVLMAMNVILTKSALQLIAYTLTGLSAILLGSFIVIKGYIPRIIGWMATLSGLVYATFGWINVDSLVFTIGRIFLVISLITFGSYLFLRGTTKKIQMKEVK